MDVIVLNTKFDIVNNDDCNAYEKKLKAYDGSDFTDEQTISLCTKFGQQIKKYHPIRNSDGYKMFHITWIRVKDAMSSKKINDKTLPALLSLIDATVDSGWTATNGEMILIFVGLLPKSYFEGMADKTKFQAHMKKMLATNLNPSDKDGEDNVRYIEDRKKDYMRRMFLDPISNETLTAHKNVVQDAVKDLYLMAWSPHKEVIGVCDNNISHINRKINKLFSDPPTKFIEVFKTVSDKILKQPVPTQEGQKLLRQFYNSNYSLLRDKKEIAEKIIFDWCQFLFRIYKLKDEWIVEIQETLTREIRMVDSKIAKTVFQNCGSLVPEAADFLTHLVKQHPICEDDEDPDSSKMRKKWDEWASQCRSIAVDFYGHCVKTSDHLEKIIPSILMLVPINNSKANDLINRSLNNMEKSIVPLFKTKPELVNLFIEKFVEFAIEMGKTEDRTEEFPFHSIICHLDDSYDKLIKIAKLSKAFTSPKVQDLLVDSIIKLTENYTLCSSKFLTEFSEFAVFKNITPEKALIFANAANSMFGTDIFDLYNPNIFCFGNIFKSYLEFIIKVPEKYSASIDAVVKSVEILLNTNLQIEYNGEMNDNASAVIMVHIFSVLVAQKSTDKVVVQFFPLLMTAAQKTLDQTGVTTTYVSFLYAPVSQMTAPQLLQVHLGQLLDLILALRDTDHEPMIGSFFFAVKTICGTDASVIEQRSDDLEVLLTERQDDDMIGAIIPIFEMIYAANPEKIKDSVLELIFEKLQAGVATFYQACQLLDVVSRTKPEILTPYLDRIIQCLRQHRIMVAHPLMQVISNLIEADKDLGDRLLPAVADLVEAETTETGLAMVLLTGLRVVGLVRHDLLCGLESRLRQWQIRNPALHDVCQHLLDVIADRSLAGLESGLSEQKAALKKVDTRVDKQEVKVKAIDKNVKKQGEEISTVNQKVDNTNLRVGAVEENVQVLDEQVKEIDLKTVSSAPKWAREVSLLLNPESDADWRLLASRLGCSAEEVRSLATQADPCMSLLSDWFAVRRNVEATRSVLEQLREMNRIDAADIVERALTAAEAVIDDEEPAEFVEPPLIFLSYQWAVQEDVKALRAHLQLAGYRCWMDIGQMGGGDKLYEAIDRGIRGSRVFVACVTAKYAESPNCKRELNLAISLHKSVIPLQLERMDWPPPGTMGPLLTEYIFIRMFARGAATDLAPGTFWPSERFRELLMQIRYGAAPEYDIVQPEYANWWLPPGSKPSASTVTIPDPATQENAASLAALPSPDVFISYQWANQTQVQQLYGLLIGPPHLLTCWMDIHQMGGGDSLYDKIDRGVRGCKVIVSCVTSKYAESPNCRREVSLGDSLKRPIVPILLEHMTWPPPGPMSMALTQLQPMSLVDEQQTWRGTATDSLIGRIVEVLRPAKVTPKVEAKVTPKVEAKITPKSIVSVTKQSQRPAATTAPAKVVINIKRPSVAAKSPTYKVQKPQPPTTTKRASVSVEKKPPTTTQKKVAAGPPTKQTTNVTKM